MTNKIKVELGTYDGKYGLRLENDGFVLRKNGPRAGIKIIFLDDEQPHICRELDRMKFDALDMFCKLNGYEWGFDQSVIEELEEDNKPLTRENMIQNGIAWRQRFGSYTGGEDNE